MNQYAKLSLLAIALTASAVQAGRTGSNAPTVNTTAAQAQAVAAAEKSANGKASSVEYEYDKQGWIYEVTVISGQNEVEVKVDAASGRVLSSKEDAHDDDDHDQNG